MKNQKTDALEVWKQFEDLLVPRLRLSVVDRAVYSHLLRHSRLEGLLRLRFSIPWLSRSTCISGGAVRDAVRRLAHKGALRLLERSKAGHVVEVRLPSEIRPTRDARTNTRDSLRRSGEDSLETTDFFRTRALRQAIHLRERGRCFYCLRRLNARIRCLDHVVPRVHSGRNSYRNLVSCCGECNSRKREMPAQDLVRRLYREDRLTIGELTARLHALAKLASGKLRPPLPPASSPQPRPRSRQRDSFSGSRTLG